jgi:hypothetical protein
VFILCWQYKSVIFAASKMWSCGRAARQRSAKPRTAVRIRSGPPKSFTLCEAFFISECFNKESHIAATNVAIFSFIFAIQFYNHERGSEYRARGWHNRTDANCPHPSNRLIAFWRKEDSRTNARSWSRNEGI